MKYLLLLQLGYLLAPEIDWREVVDSLLPAKSAAALAAERRQAFAWADTLGWPDVKQRKFVRVATGEPGGDKVNPTISYDYGFLIEDREGSFKVFTVGWLRTREYERTPPRTPPHKRVDHEPADLDEYAGSALKDRNLLDGGYRPGQNSFFFLAWACSRRGLDRRAAELYDFANTLNRWEDEQHYGQRHVDSGLSYRLLTLQQKVARRLGEEAFRDAFNAFTDDGRRMDSRQQFLTRMEQIVARFPDARRYRDAEKTVEMLRQMIKEDQEHEHRRRGGPPLEKLARKEQIAELVFQLRDQIGWYAWGSDPPDLFNNLRSKKDTPAHRLVAVGYDAVPQLIEALEDRRLTRAGVGEVARHDPTRALTVGECAEKILCRIAGLSFRGRIYSKPDPQRPYLTPEELTRAEIKAWHQQLQVKGERQLLVEATERGDADSPEQAARLVRRHPQGCLPALVKGARVARDSAVRAKLLGVAGEVPGEEAVQCLLGLLKSEPLAEVRLAVAKSLHARNRPEGLAAMIAEWHASGPATKAGKTALSEDNLQGIAEFLASSGEPEAVAALTRDHDRRSARQRYLCIRSLDCKRNQRVFSATQPQHDPADKNGKLRSAIEGLLVHALDDHDLCFRYVSAPRLADVAGVTLNELDPSRYAFSHGATLIERDVQIVKMKNVWRQANKLAALPLPRARRQPAAVPAEQLRPLLDRFLKGPALPGEPREVQMTGLIPGVVVTRKLPPSRPGQDAIEQLGLKAVTGVLQRLDATRDPSERKLLDGLAKKLACTVTDVEFAATSIKPNAAIVKHLEEMKGTPFHPKSFIQSLATILQVPGVRGMNVLVHRPAGADRHDSALRPAESGTGPPGTPRRGPCRPT